MSTTHLSITSTIARWRILGVLVVAVITLNGCVSTYEVTLKPAELDKKSHVEAPTINTLYALSRLYIVQEDEKRGEAVLARIISEYPDFTPAYSDLAKLRIKQNRVQESILILEKGLEVNINDPILHNNLGLSHVLDANYASALVSFQSAYHIDPYKEKYQANIALAYGLMGNTEQSYAFYRKILPEEDIVHNMEIINAMRDAKENSPVLDEAGFPELN